MRCCTTAIILSLSFYSFVGQAYAQSPPKLIIELSNLKSDAGKIMIAAYDQADHFLGEKAVAVMKVPVRDLVDNRIAFDGLTFGQYALSIFHDENDNGELDTNIFKIPKEPFGFSNDAKGRFGPPKFQAASFRFDSNQQVIQVRLRKI